MTHFPPELLQQIFSQLHQKDKVECLRVCRLWKLTLESTTLFQCLSIMTTIQIYRMIKRMDEEPHQRKKVKRLILGSSNLNISSLSSSFSNLEDLMIHGQITDYNIYGYIHYGPFLSCASTIRRINETYSDTFAYHILNTDLCPSLTELSISGNNYDIYFYILDLLENAPALKILDLRYYNLTLTDLDLIHEKVPLLNSLSLTFCGIDIDIRPEIITPASSIMKLYVRFNEMLLDETYVALLNYFTRKYTRVSRLLYSMDVIYGASFEDCMIMGLLPYLKQIAPFLTSLEISDPRTVHYIFPVLDQYNCHLNEFTFHTAINEDGINQIVDSNQAQSIQNFSIYLHEDYNFTHHLSKFKTLCELNITDLSGSDPEYRMGINMNCLFANIGDTLTRLKLVYTNISLDNQSFIQTRLNLKTLVLEYNTIPKGIDDFISQALPKLRTLMINRCPLMPSFFNLSTLNLSYLQVIYHFPFGQEYVLVQTLCNNENRYYTANRTTISEEEHNENLSQVFAMKSLPFEQHNKSAKVSFICNSLYSFFMVNTEN